MKKRAVLITLLTILLIIITPGAVKAVPPVPYVPNGTVMLNGEYVPPGTEITAYCDGVQYGAAETTLSDGVSYYIIYVSGDDTATPGIKEGCYDGETVTFKVDGVTADQEGVWDDGSETLNLTATKLYPDITIEKYVNGQAADNAPGPYLLAGSDLTWSYTVSNTGETPLTDIVVTDDNGTSSNLDDDFEVCGPFDLAVGENHTCYLNSTAQPGSYVNIATVTANTPEDPPETDSDPAYYFGATPAADLVKRTNLEDANIVPGVYLEQGSDVAWTYEVTNSGNVDLSNVLVIDDNGTPGDTSDDVTICTIALLPAGNTDTTSCHLNGKAVAGQYSNIAVVTGTPPGGLADVSDEDPSHYFGSVPDITIQKKLNGVHYDAIPGPYLLIGDSIAWTYLVENTGNVNLTGIIVIDDSGTPVDSSDDLTAGCPKTTLVPGETMTCELTDTAATLGQYHNVVIVSGTPPVGTNKTASASSYYFGADPAVEVEFLVNDNPADSALGLYVLAGTDITLKYAVYNAGNVPLTNLVVSDSLGNTCNIPNLNVGATDDSTCTRTVKAGVGPQSFFASVTAKPPGGLSSITSETDYVYYFGATPGITLDKQTNGQDAAETPGAYVLTGSTVNWTYDVTNTGNVVLTDVTVVDDKGVTVSCPKNSLAVDESIQCTASDTAQEGQYTNIATVTGSPPGTLSPVQVSDTSHYFGATLSVNLAKQTNGRDAETEPGPYISAGDPVNWTYTITNDSNVDISFVIVDNPTVAITCPKYALIAKVGEVSDSVVCTASDPTAEAGQYTNTATVTVTPPEGLTVFDVQDTSHYFGVTTGIDIQKKTNGQDADDPTGPLIKVGTAINWAYVVTNLSNIPINSIVVTDSDETLEITCPSAELGAGAFMTCTASGTAEAGQYENTGTVTAATVPPGFGPLTDTDPSHYFGSDAGVEINKLTNDVDIDSDPIPYILVGDPVSWSYVITNVGNIQINEILVTDSDAALLISCPTTTLAPSASMTCTAQGNAQAGEYTNTGYVEAVPEGFIEKVQNSDDSAYIGANPSITIEKYTNGQDADAEPGPYIPVGEPLTFEYQVTSAETLYRFTDISVSDDSGVTVNCDSTTFGPGDSPIICSAKGEGAADIGQQSFSGYVTARAIVVSTGNELGEVSDDDPSHYFGYTPSGLTLTKFTNGINVEEPPGPELLVGNTVTWTYDVKNESNAPVTTLSVEDDDPAVTVSCDKIELEGNETVTCFGSSEVVEGQYTNTAQASGIFIPTDSEIRSTTATSYYFGIKGSKLFLPLIMR